MARYVTNSSDKSKTITLILCLILGLIGGHDFYLGKIGSGLLKLFTCNLFGIGWFIDLIMTATGRYRDNVGALKKKKKNNNTKKKGVNWYGNSKESRSSRD